MPTNPVNISTFTDGVLPNGDSAFGTFIPSNGALYSVVSYNDPGTFTTEVAVYKSVDAGATWTAQDISNQPTTNECFNACLTNDTIVMLSADGSTFVNFYLFDTSTDTFGTTVVTDQKYGPQIGLGVSPPYLNDWDTSPMCGRADGTVVLGTITYTLDTTPVHHFLWWRSQYMIFDSTAGTWTSWAQCGITDGTPLTSTTVQIHSSIDSIVPGDGVVHFILSEWDGNYNNSAYIDGTFQRLQQQTLSDADSLGSMSVIKTIDPYIETDEFGNPSSAFPTATRNRYRVVSDSTTVMLAWLTSVTSPFEDLTVLVGTSADPISFAETDLTISNPETGDNANFFYSVGALVSTAGNYVFLANADGSKFGYWLDSGSGFGTFHLAGTWNPTNMTAVYIGAPYNTWAASGNGDFSFTAQFWNPLFGGAGKGPRSYAYIGSAPFAPSR